MWLGKLTALDITPLGWLGRKTSTQTNKHWLKNQLKVLFIQRSTLCKRQTEEPACGCYSKTYLMSNTIQRISLGFLLSKDLACVKHWLKNRLVVLGILRSSLCQTQIEVSACGSCYSKIFLMSNTDWKASLWFLLFKDLPYVKHYAKDQLMVLIIKRSSFCQTLTEESACGFCYSKHFFMSNTEWRNNLRFLLFKGLPSVKPACGSCYSKTYLM